MTSTAIPVSETLDLSILIPVYDTDVVPLLKSLLPALTRFQGNFEIIVSDDASPNTLLTQQNKAYCEDFGISYMVKGFNSGRSRNRNFLAERAKGQYFLFIDADSTIRTEDFITSYWEQRTLADALCGGTAYGPKPKEGRLRLRWMYGVTREATPAAKRNASPYPRLSLNNLFISNSAYRLCRLNEMLKEYGHEDTLLAFELKRKGLSLIHIDNPVIHTGLEDVQVFLKKTEQASANLVRLCTMPELGVKTKMFYWVETLDKFGFLRPISWVFKSLKPLNEIWLRSSVSTILCFDAWRFGILTNLFYNPPKPLTAVSEDSWLESVT